MSANAERARRELVERIYRAFNTRDEEAVLGLLGRDFEWHPSPDEPEQRVARTPAEVAAGLRERWESLSRLHTEIEELSVLRGRLLAVVRHEAVLHGSETPIERREVHVWSFRAGRVSGLQEFPTRDAALRAVGDT